MALTVNEMTFEAIQRSMILSILEKAIQDSEPPRCAGDFMEMMEFALF